MDAAQLITLVQEHRELYDTKHPHYSNQLRRDNIWEEIGERLNQNANACKERWTRIRDNHRKALNLRKTKSRQASSKIKPPKFFHELSFIIPYLNDEEVRHSSLSRRTVHNDDETQAELSSSNNLPTKVSSEAPFDDMIESPVPSRTARRKSSSTASPGPSAAHVLQEYITRKEQNRNQSDPLIEFFINMAKTVKSFPLQDQIKIKAQLFQMVNSVEMKLATSSMNISECMTGSNENLPVKTEHVTSLSLPSAMIFEPTTSYLPPP